MKKYFLILAILSASLPAFGAVFGGQQLPPGTVTLAGSGTLTVPTSGTLASGAFAPALALGTGSGNAAPGTVAPYAVGGAMLTGTLDASLCLLQSGSTSVSGTLAAPANGIAGRQLEVWLTVSGTTDRALSLASAIKLPSDSALALPKTLTAGKLYILKLWHNGSAWMLVSLVGGY